MLEFIYYTIVVFFILMECSYVLNNYKKIKSSGVLIGLNKKYAGLKWNEIKNQTYKSLVFRHIFNFITVITFLVGGLFTRDWIAIVFLLAIQISIILPLSNLIEPKGINKCTSMSYRVLIFINSLIGLLVGAYILTNKLFLNIDLFEIVENFLR